MWPGALCSSGCVTTWPCAKPLERLINTPPPVHIASLPIKTLIQSRVLLALGGLNPYLHFTDEEAGLKCPGQSAVVGAWNLGLDPCP